MTKAATIKNNKLLCLVAAAAMVIATVMALIVPRVAQAAESEGITGSFTVGNEAPDVTAAVLYDAEHSGTETQMTPQTEYSIKVTVSDTGTLDDLGTVVVYVFYDSDGDDTWATNTPSANTQTCYVMTCTVGGANGTWAGNPNSDTSWSILSDNCDQPTLTGPSGDFYFNFIPGKVATEALDWDVYAVATDDSVQTDSYYGAGDYDMLWYGEIDVITGSVAWGTVLAGMNFDSGDAKETVSIKYTSNGNYDAAVATAATWGSATLDIDGTPASNNFSLKAWSSDNLTAADFVTTTAGDCVIDNTGALTGESGVTDADNTVYLDLGTPFVDGNYSGTITFYIRSR